MSDIEFDRDGPPYGAYLLWFMRAVAVLWMAATWGGVIWLIASGSYFIISLFRPEIFGRQYAMMTTIGVLILLYVGLAFLASRERRHP